ncbi:hypothetical protein [Brevibacterium linens]|uniref:Uncharacterized protein n=1 Tax=Brevibacterium linens TaxID=1703 RepID=A0A142NRC8_BRELN|nr:hypothetical protein [Brevibacterium linens]AMT94920.1 hypothetical protein A2T55_15270 [Brevibacterium linens]
MTAPDQDELITELTAVLAKSLRALGKAGQPDEASRLGATGWSLLRHDHPREAEKINGTMHYLARLPGSPSSGELAQADSHSTPES